MKLKLIQITTLLFQKLKYYWEIYRSNFAPVLVNFFLFFNFISLFKSFLPNFDVSDDQINLPLKAEFDKLVNGFNILRKNGDVLSKQFYDMNLIYLENIKKLEFYEMENSLLKMEVEQLKSVVASITIKPEIVSPAIPNADTPFPSLSDILTIILRPHDIIDAINGALVHPVEYACLGVAFGVCTIGYFHYAKAINSWFNNSDNKKVVCHNQHGVPIVQRTPQNEIKKEELIVDTSKIDNIPIKTQIGQKIEEKSNPFDPRDLSSFE